MTDTLTQRRTYTVEQKAAVLAAIASGQSIPQAAAAFGIPLGTVQAWGTTIRTLVNVEDYKEEIKRRVTAYASHCFDTLDSQVQLLGDRSYLEAHGADVFAVAQSHRLVAEQLARFLAAVYG